MTIGSLKLVKSFTCIKISISQLAAEAMYKYVLVLLSPSCLWTSILLQFCVKYVENTDIG